MNVDVFKDDPQLKWYLIVSGMMFATVIAVWLIYKFTDVGIINYCFFVNTDTYLADRKKP
jgi:hypothetical protein